MTAEPTRLAVLGTGIMGGAMAGRWAEHGYAVTAWNRDRAKAEALTALGVTATDSPAAAVADADVVVTMLADGPVTESVVRGALDGLRPGRLWLQMATVGVEATDRLATLAHEAGLGFVDAPVTGTRQPAERGRLTVLAGGPDELRARAEATFQPVAARVVWVGGVGAGSRLKLVVNAWLAALLAGLAESIALAEAMGIDPRLFLSAIDGSPVGTGYASVKGTMMIDRDYPTSFPLRLLTKDVDLVAEAAASHGVPLRLPDALRSLLAAAETDHADDDMSAIIEALRD